MALRWLSVHTVLEGEFRTEKARPESVQYAVGRTKREAWACDRGGVDSAVQRGSHEEDDDDFVKSQLRRLILCQGR